MAMAKRMIDEIDSGFRSERMPLVCACQSISLLDETIVLNAIESSVDTIAARTAIVPMRLKLPRLC